PPGTFASAGQLALDPVQFSATSHSPAEERHTVVLAANPLAGQVALAPLQVSATSHTPAAERKVLPDARKAHADVQHDVDWPLAVPRSHASPGPMRASPQTSTCAIDQPSPRTLLSSSTLPLQVTERTVA